MANFTDPSRPNFVPPCPPPPELWDDGRKATLAPTVKSRHSMKSKYEQRACKQELTRSDPPALAVYHICRICLRPRSERYHREHPIPTQGLPPPPGICRRCRVTSESEVTQNTSYVQKSSVRSSQHHKAELQAKQVSKRETVYIWPPRWDCSSHAVKLGIGCFVPEEDRFSQLPPEARQPPLPQTSTLINVGFGCVDAGNSSSSRSHDDRRLKASEYDERVSRSMEYRTTEATGKQAKPQPPQITGDSALSMTQKLYLGTSQDDQQTIRARDASQYPDLEATIRKVAREEVERYRRAERLMNAHPEAYAHGRMVPISPKSERKTVVDGVRDRESHHSKPQTQADRTADINKTKDSGESTSEMRGKSNTRAPKRSDEAGPEFEYTYIRKTVQPATSSTHSRVQFSERVDAFSPPHTRQNSQDRDQYGNERPKPKDSRPLHQAFSESPTREHAQRRQTSHHSNDSGVPRTVNHEFPESMQAASHSAAGKGNGRQARLSRRGLSTLRDD